MKPNEIEKLSFRIIDDEAGQHNFSVNEWTIVRRMIHTSADFSYMKKVRFHPRAIESGLDAIKQGRTIITDTEMAKAGISLKQIKKFGVEVKCLINDPEVEKLAKQLKTTRASAAVDIVFKRAKCGVYVVGNAPTALLRLMELIKEKKAKPNLVIGLPVGFVNAVESKEKLISMNYPCISNTSRKGGSNIAASVVNALVKLI